MGETTKIEWADATWNPVIGCAKVSPACTNCYAEAQYKRFGRPELWRGERQVTSAKTWRLPEEVDALAAAEGRRLRLFVASLSDVFEDHTVWNTEAPSGAPWARTVGVALRVAVLRKLARLKHVDVLLLTKRPEHVLRMVPPEWLPETFVEITDEGQAGCGEVRWGSWPAHVWIGTTVEDQQRAEERIPHLLRVPAAVRFVSYEPALGPVDLESIVCDTEPLIGRSTGSRRYDALGGSLTCWPPKPQEGPRIHWVIAGGESGSKARPAHPDWFRSVRDQCARAGVPFLFKQWGEWLPCRGNEHMLDDASATLSLWPDARSGYDTSTDSPNHMMRVGKKAAGRLLDGVLHDGFPEVDHG